MRPVEISTTQSISISTTGIWAAYYYARWFWLHVTCYRAVTTGRSRSSLTVKKTHWAKSGSPHLLHSSEYALNIVSWWAAVQRSLWQSFLNIVIRFEASWWIFFFADSFWWVMVVLGAPTAFSFFLMQSLADLPRLDAIGKSAISREREECLLLLKKKCWGCMSFHGNFSILLNNCWWGRRTGKRAKGAKRRGRWGRFPFLQSEVCNTTTECLCMLSAAVPLWIMYLNINKRFSAS